MNTQIIRPPGYQKPSGRYLSANFLNQANDSYILVPVDSIQSDYTDGIENITTHRITPGVAGFYNIKGQIRYINAYINNAYYRAAIKLSGAIIDIFELNSPLSTEVSCPVNLINRHFSVTDYLEIYLFKHGDTTAADVSGGSQNTYLELQRVR